MRRRLIPSLSFVPKKVCLSAYRYLPPSLPASCARASVTTRVSARLLYNFMNVRVRRFALEQVHTRHAYHGLPVHVHARAYSCLCVYTLQVTVCLVHTAIHAHNHTLKLVRYSLSAHSLLFRIKVPDSMPAGLIGSPPFPTSTRHAPFLES